MNDKRAFVFVDGGNFYFKLKELSSKFNEKHSLIDFDFRRFAKNFIKNFYRPQTVAFLCGLPE